MRGSLDEEDIRRQINLLVEGVLKDGLETASGCRVRVVDVEDRACPICGRRYLRYTTQLYGATGSPIGEPRKSKKDVCSACRLLMDPYGYWVHTDPDMARAMEKNGVFKLSAKAGFEPFKGGKKHEF